MIEAENCAAAPAVKGDHVVVIGRAGDIGELARYGSRQKRVAARASSLRGSVSLGLFDTQAFSTAIAGERIKRAQRKRDRESLGKPRKPRDAATAGQSDRQQRRQAEDAGQHDGGELDLHHERGGEAQKQGRQREYRQGAKARIAPLRSQRGSTSAQPGRST